MSLDRERYRRHMSLEEVGEEGQARLKNARVLCVGLGGLGTPLALYLASSGVGTLGLVDGDVVEASNLARQILYSPSDIGKQKVAVAKERLLHCNPDTSVHTYPCYVDATNALDIFGHYDVIADCSDNFATRYLVSDACKALAKTHVFAGVYKHQGQLAVFNGADGACFRCVFDSADPRQSPQCAEVGVLATSVGIVGLWQAHEIIKQLLQWHSVDVGQFLCLDLRHNKVKTYHLRKDPSCSSCNNSLGFDALPRPTLCKVASEKWIDKQRYAHLCQKSQLLTIDVREAAEYAQGHVSGAMNIPLSEIAKIPAVAKNMDIVVLYCKSGIRSAKAYQILKPRLPHDLYILRTEW